MTRAGTRSARSVEPSRSHDSERKHGYAFDDVRVVNPFASPDRTPEEVLESLAS